MTIKQLETKVINDKQWLAIMYTISTIIVALTSHWTIGLASLISVFIVIKSMRN